jgi:hypothetical protein
MEKYPTVEEIMYEFNIGQSYADAIMTSMKTRGWQNAFTNLGYGILEKNNISQYNYYAIFSTEEKLIGDIRITYLCDTHQAFKKTLAAIKRGNRRIWKIVDLQKLLKGELVL